MTRVAVMGTGSWGTTFAVVLADAGGRVRMWGRRPEICREITEQHRNTEYLGGLALSRSISADPDPTVALRDADLVVLALPSQSLRANLAAWRGAIRSDAVMVSLMKGIEDGTMRRMSQVICEVGGTGPERVAVISGPNLASEIARREPTATVVAAADHAVADRVAEACSTGYFRPYTNTDVIGVELGGALKNVIGLAVGIAEGMGFGDNAKASIITRGLAETARLGVALGAEPATFAGLAGLGDLVATCASPLSRNRTFGVHLGRGMPLAEVIRITNRTAEGVTSCRPILQLAAAHGVDLPICEQVTAVVYDGEPLEGATARLFARARKAELA
jgi:glycerol-3-phosphate dehydrogenase (NAD(P)+)